MSSTTALLMTLLTVSAVQATYGYFYAIPANLCSGKLVDSKLEPVLQDCPVPGIFPGSVPPLPSTIGKVTKPATIQEIDVAWFLNDDANPALNITFAASSPDSPQVYELNVLYDGYTVPVFCGKIHTPQPAGGQQKEKQTISVEMRCDGGRLKADTEVHVSVQAMGTPEDALPKAQTYELPSCTEQTMYKSNDCIEQRKKRIKFRLHQEGNSTVVDLLTMTAYPKQSKGSKVTVAIRSPKSGTIEGWQFVGQPVDIFWPQRTFRFDGLTPGQTYQVLVWRAGEYTRYSEVIVMRSESKKDRYNDGLVGRLLKRSVQNS